MEKDYLILKRASASRPCGEWDEDDFDVIAEVGRIFKVNAAPVGQPDVDISVRTSRRSHPHTRLRRDARGRDDGIRKKLAAGVRRF
jgi:hypothetical protein